MNKNLQQAGIAAVAFTENHKRYIAAGDHNFFEYWLGTVELFQDVLVRTQK